MAREMPGRHVRARVPGDQRTSHAGGIMGADGAARGSFEVRPRLPLLGGKGVDSAGTPSEQPHGLPGEDRDGQLGISE